MALPEVRHYINTRISGSPGGWPLDWFQGAFPGLRFGRVLSVGCGGGALERDLIARNLCQTIDAFDGSVASLALARTEAVKSQIAHRVRYFASDFNRPVLPANYYDAVFVHQAMHHVAKLEKLLRAVLLGLKTAGILYLDEYVGPSRHYWNPKTAAGYSQYYERLPRHIRWFDTFPLPIKVDDPSEAIRSGEIYEQLQIGFDTVADRGYGGNLLAVVFPALNMDLVSLELLGQLIGDEKGMLERNERDFHAIIVAHPKAGLRKRIASARYFIEPKIKRIFREIKNAAQRLAQPRAR